jgi:hypothetical protein
MKTITYYLQGKVHEYIPDVKIRMVKRHHIKYFLTLVRYPDKVRKFEGKTDWQIYEKYVSRAKKASRWRWSERRGFTVN